MNLSDIFKYNLGFYIKYSIISEWLQGVILPQWVCSQHFVKTAIRKLAGAFVFYVWLKQSNLSFRRRSPSHGRMGQTIDLQYHHQLVPTRRPLCPAGRRAFSEQIVRPHHACGMVDEADDAQSMPRYVASHGKNGRRPCLDMGPELGAVSSKRHAVTRSMLRMNPKQPTFSRPDKYS